MKICQAHWEQLGQAIKSKGIYDLVAHGEDAKKNWEGELKGEPKTLQNYDPLMAANWMIHSRALDCFGLAIMMPKEDGTPQCPICVVEKEGCTTWIDGCTSAVAEHVKTLAPS